MMGGLKDLEFKDSYYSEDSNLLEDFYIPALSKAKEYNRITGYFSANSLAIAAKGISEIIENEGKINLITGFFISKKDVSAAEEVQKDPQKILNEIEKIIENFNNIEDILTKEVIKAFAWLLAKNLLKIKIAIPKSKEGYGSLFHQKIGIIKDDEGQQISFSGSINETGTGWLSNIENFKVFRSWEKGEEKYLEADRKHFMKLWNNIYEKIDTIPLNEASKKKIVAMAPEEKEDIDLDILKGKNRKASNKEPIFLRNYQKDAIKEWEKNDHLGIIEMATGTGKTILGIKAIEKFLDKSKEKIGVILAPTKEICSQWADKIEKHIEKDKSILVGSNNLKWKRETYKYLHNHSRGRCKKLFFISTYESLPSLFEFFKEYRFHEALIIADEVHSFGAEERSNIIKNLSFKEMFKFRLGLSATPERLFDEEGNKLINSFFDKTVDKFEIGDAIREGWLSPYEYYFRIVEMDKNEYKDYLELTKKIGRMYFMTKDKEENDAWNILVNKRAKILKDSKNKLKLAEEIISNLISKKIYKYTLIFCVDSNQLQKVSEILDKKGIIYSKITGEEKKQRESIINSFKEGNIQILLSIKILDEGIDIPEINNAIIMSSSRNPREYIQRRGRVLRKAENKVARIYDIMVSPPDLSDLDEKARDMEREIVRKELLRIFEFSKYSQNKGDILDNKKLEKIIRKYNLYDMYKILRNKN